MKRFVFVFALIIPAVSMAAFEPQAQPPSQGHWQGLGQSSQPGKAHRQLFQLRYVLESAIPKKKQDLPSIDLGDGRAAIDAASLSAQRSVPVRSQFQPPNMIICRAWACLESK